MSIWRALQDYAWEMADDIGAIGGQIGQSIKKTVEPIVQNAAETVDRALDGRGQKIVDEVGKRAIVADKRFQRFMVRRIDPLFGETRVTQIEEISSLEIGPDELTLNRRIALSAGFFAAAIIGKLVFPASLLVTVPLSFSMVLPIYGKARTSVKQQRRITYHVVSAISFTAVWIGGYYMPALGAMLCYYMGEKLLLITEDRSRRGFISIFSKQPRTMWVVRDDVEREVPFEDVSRGDIVIVQAGGFIPVDGTVVTGFASIDQHALTGEAQPAEKARGETVYASTVVLAGKIWVRVEKAGNETVAAKIGEVLNQTASYQLALQTRGSKIAHDSALPTLLLAAAALPLGASSALAMLNSTFGVSIRISAPSSMLNLFNIASAHAILMKDGRSLELLSDVDTVLFDKTGTLTTTQPHVAAVHSAGVFERHELLAFAAAAEHRQTHPIALAILAEAKACGIPIPHIDHAQYEVGYGIKVTIGDRMIQVGSDRYMTQEAITIPSEIAEQRTEAQAKGHSLVMIAVDGVLAGAIELQPTIRPEAESVIAALRKRGLKMAIISGDQEEPTRRLAEKLGMDRYFANVLPEGKAGLVQQLQSEGRGVCFVGDGINDSIALKKANVSVSLRGATTAATDSAQVVLMQESLEKLPALFELADDMERCLRWGYAAGMIPGVINVASIFLLGTGYPFAVFVALTSLTAGMGVSVYPRYKYRKQLAQAAAVPRSPDKAPIARPPLLLPMHASA